ncbi:MAG: histidine phosphatase family protein [Nocardioides sp.]
MQSTTRVLVIMRHSKAEPSGASDHERVLTDRGTADADEAGAWLGRSGTTPDRALVSDAARTRGTWEALAGGAGWSLAPDYDASLYAAGPETALDLVRETDDSVGTLVVVGHNPTMAYVAQMLDDGEGDAEAVAGMNEGFPTSAVAVFAVEGPWADLEMGGARLTAFHVGRG